MSGFVFGQRSLTNLEGVHADLVSVCQRAIEVSLVDFGIIEGRRSPTRQVELVAAGASRTTNSKHLIGHAVDVAAYSGGIISWEWHYYPVIAGAMQQASQELGIQVVWGCVWNRQLASLTADLEHEVAVYKASRKGKAFLDAGHYELRMPPLTVTA